MSRSNAVVTFNQKMEWLLLYRKLTMVPSGFEIWEVSTCRNGKAAPSHLDQASEALLPCSQVRFTPCSCQCATWQGWAAWILIPSPPVEAGSQAESCSFPSSTQWHALPQGNLRSLLWKAVNYTPITAWKWLGKYFERRRNFVETTALWVTYGWKKANWKISLANDLLNIIRLNGTAPSLPSPLSYLLAFLHLLFKVWWNYSFQIDFF